MDETRNSGILIDTEITEQVISPAVLERAKRLYRDAHGQFHRGRFIDAFEFYTEGLAAGLAVNVEDLREFIGGLS